MDEAPIAQDQIREEADYPTKIKDVVALVWFGDESFVIRREGYVSPCYAEKTYWYPIHGRRVLMRQLYEERMFEVSEKELRRTSDITKVVFHEEPERALPPKATPNGFALG
jgi:hypothetical protein